MISIIVAQSKNGVIGRDGDIPWRGQLPADMNRFKALTMGHAVVMGRATYESIPEKFRPLAKRCNVVLSRNPDYDLQVPADSEADCWVETSILDGLHRARTEVGGEIFVIGGASVYRDVLPIADRVYMTLIDAEFEGDAAFPFLDETQWQIGDPRPHVAAGANRYGYVFVTYERREGTK